jgi:hypothetical protein
MDARSVEQHVERRQLGCSAVVVVELVGDVLDDECEQREEQKRALLMCLVVGVEQLDKRESHPH